MNLLYVDESGDTGRTGTDHLVLGAAVLFECKGRHLREALRKSVLRLPEMGTPWAALEDVIVK